MEPDPAFAPFGGRVRMDDDYSFEDSERFEDDSQVSWESNDGPNQNWRGWAQCPSQGEAIQPGQSCVVYQYQYPPSGRYSSSSTNTVVQQRASRNDTAVGSVLPLSEISSRICAEKWSFQQLEGMYQHICAERAMTAAVPMPNTIPEKIFLSIIVHCFPQTTDEIRMYSTLANGSCEQFNAGNSLYELGAVRKVSQTGFMLSGEVMSNRIYILPSVDKNGRVEPVCENGTGKYHVTVKVDRCRIVACDCECSKRPSSWCQHVVALCIYRIHQKQHIKFSETIADAINSMNEFELRKLIQWHLSKVPSECIPKFQELIDQIKDANSDINQHDGAPDPTDGGHEAVSRYDFPEIEEKIRRLLCKYCVPSPSVHCDVQYLSTTQHPITVEWNSLIKPLRAREPEGMWNLVQMVREMLARRDENAVLLLATITDECISNTQVLLWWYVTKLVQSGFWMQQSNGKAPAASQTTAQYNCAQLCDEVVELWKCVAINPHAGKGYRSQLAAYLQEYHRSAVNRLRSMIGGMIPGMGSEDQGRNVDTTVISNHQATLVVQSVIGEDGNSLHASTARFTVDAFPGFFTALQMCHALCEQDVDFGVSKTAAFDLQRPNLNRTVLIVAPAPPPEKKSKKKKKKGRTSSSRRHNRDGNDVPQQRFVDFEDLANVPGNAGNNWANEIGMWEAGAPREVPVRRQNNSRHGNQHREQNLYGREVQRRSIDEESTESGQESDVQTTSSNRNMPSDLGEGSSQGAAQASTSRRRNDGFEADVNEVLAAAFLPLDAIEARFLKCEAFATHGFRGEAVEQSLKIIDYLLDSLKEQSSALEPAQLQIDEASAISDQLPGPSASVSTDNFDSRNTSATSALSFTSTNSSLSSSASSSSVELFVAKSNRFLGTLEKLLYVTKVLRPMPHLHSKVFWLTLKTLTVPKYPLATSHQQMKLYYCEAEFVAILEQLAMAATIGASELEHVRTVAKQLIAHGNGITGDVPPIALAQFVFETLHSIPASNDELAAGNNHSTRSFRHHKQGDDDLALQTALTLLGATPTFCDTSFPMHCEAIRRQRNDIALMLLSRFKESHEKLGLIMDKLLDPTHHRMYQNHSSNAAYFLERDSAYLKHYKNQERPNYPYNQPLNHAQIVQQGRSLFGQKNTGPGSSTVQVPVPVEDSLQQMSIAASSSQQKAGTISRERLSDDGQQSSSASEVSTEGASSSSSSTASTANVGPSNLIPSWQQAALSNMMMPTPYGLTRNNALILAQTRGKPPGDGQKKGRIKRRLVHLLNPKSSATEAHVYHMQELAKKVLQEAGGSQNSVVFALGNPIIGTTHRKLHLCAVIIAVYAMGMHNRVSPSWNTRTYSTAASWIAGQTQDIGPMAVEMIRETWTSHFTPSEVAAISDKASLSSEPQMREEATKLALSVLPYAASLSDEEIIRALEKCRDQSRDLLIQGLLAIDTPIFRQTPRTKALFTAMQHWLDLNAEEEAAQAQAQKHATAQHLQPQMQFYQHQFTQPPPQYHNPYSHNPYDNLRPNVSSMLPQRQMLQSMMQQGGPSTSQGPPPSQQPAVTASFYGHAGSSTSQSNPAAPHSAGGVPPPQMMFAQPPPNVNPYMYQQPPPQHNNIEQSRLHQSHSAPQLGAPPPPLSSVTLNEELNEQQLQQHHASHLVQAFRCGLRAMDCIATSPGEERQVYLKYGRTPPYSEEISKLYHVARQLGVQQTLTFFNTAARALTSPHVLHQYAKESARYFPPRSFMQPPPPPMSSQSSTGGPPPPASTAGPMPLMAQQITQPHAPMPYHSGIPQMSQQQHIQMIRGDRQGTNAYKFNGVISNIFVQNGSHHVTGELFERACEQYFLAIVNKMNHPRISTSDYDEISEFIQCASETFKWIPGPMGRNLFDDFVRTIKKQKSFKKDLSNAINNTLNQLF